MRRIPFVGGPLDGAIMEMSGLPCGPIGISVGGGDGMIGTTVECSEGPVYWYDWWVSETGDEAAMFFTVRQVQ